MDKRVSEAELDIMETLWSSTGAMTANEVADKVAPKRGWSLPTVKTMLSRLSQKGAVRYEAEGRRYLYTAAIERTAYVGGESRRLVERLFGGKLSPMIARLAEDDALTPDDIAEIEALLKELKQ
ncbi:BlaI/MecI/CopY family transcriptional regulator [Sphingomicrobium sediminis]|uniref:BlaI/MecI/CopY family transcriptional regulator n=1 Tax=Sphingomicrobium sediminis TaxID=2950949 RepID=A0A9X2EG36_9SPHN|nr:BlaI/MecI/CopY family transcriptional regulator [Sphingomicrobium sediminis]